MRLPLEPGHVGLDSMAQRRCTLQAPFQLDTTLQESKKLKFSTHQIDYLPVISNVLSIEAEFGESLFLELSASLLVDPELPGDVDEACGATPYLCLVGNGRMVVIVVIIVPHSSVSTVSREWKNGSNSGYNCTPFLHFLLQ